jgi:hypothetical protein
VRRVDWLRRFGVIAILIAALTGASAQTLDSELGGLEPDDQPAPGFGVASVLGLPSADGASPDLSPDDLSASDDLTPLAMMAPGPELSGGRPTHALLFGGYDVWRDGVATYGGFEWSADPQADSGFIVRLMVSQASERYRAPTFTYTTDFLRAAALPGWRIKRGAFELKVFAGPDVENRALAPDIVGQRWRGTHGGARILVESWVEPTSETMLAAAFYATTIAGSYGARVAAGWRPFDGPWIGPEVSGSSDEFSRQTRAGVHFTGLRLAALEWSAAAGVVRDSFGRRGLYTRFSASLRQ